MKFNSLEFIVLLSVTTALFFALPYRGRFVLLVLAGCIFYGAWSVPFLSLIFVTAVVDFSAGLAIAGTERPFARRLWLVLSLGTNLGILGFFKYANFFVDSVRDVWGLQSNAPFLEVALPAGISFYTFQSMSYTIDVYRRQIAPTRSPLRFMVYVSFFPQLMAGPIERAGHMLPQFDYTARQPFSLDNVGIGCRLIVWGLFKKVMFADYFGMLADTAFADPAGCDRWGLLVGIYAFTLQLYCDFSAYSEIARGSARFFGVDLMQNFDQPYLAMNIGEFWRRWHISLSTWFRDYVYIPLGGSQLGRIRTLANLTVTMFLSGLWHGAAWTFVLWGLYHGFLLLTHVLVRETRAFRALRTRLGAGWPTLAWLVTFHAVVLGWILFRASSIQSAWEILMGSFGNFSTFALPNVRQSLFFGVLICFLIGSDFARRKHVFRRINSDPGLSATFYGALIVVMVLFGLENGPQFIYFQF